MNGTDLARLNSATKYPPIMTYHALDPKNGRLLEETNLPFGDDTPVVLTEKVDGTNGRVIVMPDGDWFIGSREELLYARGDRIENPALGIVPALLPLAPTLAPGVEDITVYFLEVYGKGIGGNGKQYTGEGRTGYRLFDVGGIPLSILEMERGQISSWRDHGGQKFGTEVGLRKLADWHGNLPLTPRLSIVKGGDLPTTLKGMRDFLTRYLLSDDGIARTRAALDEAAGGRPEGIVLRTQDRSLIAKARFADYDRTLNPQQGKKKREG